LRNTENEWLLGIGVGESSEQQYESKRKVERLHFHSNQNLSSQGKEKQICEMMNDAFHQIPKTFQESSLEKG
jgi:hypothetical protein